MRTTLTLDEDVAAMLRKALKDRNSSLKAVINEGLRRGLGEKKPPREVPPYRTVTADLGRCLTGGVDDISDLIALVEGESFR